MDNYSAYLEHFKQQLIEEERSPNTITSYMSTLNSYFKMYDAVTKENMIAFKRDQLNKNKPSTAKLRCAGMNKFCDFVGKPECKVKIIKIPKVTKAENVPTKEEYFYILDCLKADNKMKMYWMIRFIASTGARISELLSMNKECLNTGVTEIFSKGKMRRIIIPGKLIQESRDYFGTVDNDLLFPNRYNKRMSTRGAAFEMSKMQERYNVRPEILHPHAFRHFFAIQFLNNGGKLALLADLMGHDSLKTTAIYLTLSESEQRKQLEDCLNW